MLVLPKLQETDCLMLDACGTLAQVDAAQVKRLKKIADGTVALSKAGYVMLGGNDDGHFHIDLVSKDFIGNDKPEVTMTLTEARKIIKLFYGQQVKTTFGATFKTSIDQLPQVIRKQVVKSSSGSVTVETIGGKLKVSGAPFHLITWWVTESGGARIQLLSNAIATIDDQYLAAGFSPLVFGFNALTSRVTPDVIAEPETA